MDRGGSIPGATPAWGWGMKLAGPQQHQEPASIQAPPPARWIRCHPSCRAQSSWTPRGCPPGPLGRGGQAPPALPGPDAALPGARLGAGQGESSLAVGHSRDPLPRPVGLSGLGEQPPARAVSLPRDPQLLDGRLTTVLIFMGFSSLDTREISQRSLLPGVFFF